MSNIFERKFVILNSQESLLWVTVTDKCIRVSNYKVLSSRQGIIECLRSTKVGLQFFCVDSNKSVLQTAEALSLDAVPQVALNSLEMRPPKGFIFRVYCFEEIFTEELILLANLSGLLITTRKGTNTINIVFIVKLDCVKDLKEVLFNFYSFVLNKRVKKIFFTESIAFGGIVGGIKGVSLCAFGYIFRHTSGLPKRLLTSDRIFVPYFLEPGPALVPFDVVNSSFCLNSFFNMGFLYFPKLSSSCFEGGRTYSYDGLNFFMKLIAEAVKSFGNSDREAKMAELYLFVITVFVKKLVFKTTKACVVRESPNYVNYKGYMHYKAELNVLFGFTDVELEKQQNLREINSHGLGEQTKIFAPVVSTKKKVLKSKKTSLKEETVSSKSDVNWRVVYENQEREAEALYKKEMFLWNAQTELRDLEWQRSLNDPTFDVSKSTLMRSPPKKSTWQSRLREEDKARQKAWTKQRGKAEKEAKIMADIVNVVPTKPDGDDNKSDL